MKEKSEYQSAESLLSVKEAAYILRISPKTIYNRLWKGDFPLSPVRVPWNRRAIFFRRSEVIAMERMPTYQQKPTLSRLLDSIAEPVRPILVALCGTSPFAPREKRYPLLEFTVLDSSQLPGWSRKYDLLLVQRRRPAICLAAPTAEHFRAAALLGAVIAVEMRGR